MTTNKFLLTIWPQTNSNVTTLPQTNKFLFNYLTSNKFLLNYFFEYWRFDANRTLVAVIFRSLKPQTNSRLTDLLQINYFTTLSQKNICLTTKPQINSYLTTLSQKKTKKKQKKKPCLTNLSQTNCYLTTSC